MIMAEMSADITFFQILPRLPVKSVCRFQCVSKQWHSFLSTPEFTKIQLRHQNHKDDHYNLLVFSSTHPYTFRIIECENPKQNCSTTDNRPLPFELGKIQDRSILTSFHGMVCVGIINTSRWVYSDLILWNPLTGHYKTLSKAGSHEECYYIYGDLLFQLYYSSFDDDYKLLRVTLSPNVYIYSLKYDSWRKVESILEPFPTLQSYSRPSVLLNEICYFLEITNIGNYSVIRFDTKTEKFTKIATPFSTEPRFIRFMVLRGCIHFIFLSINMRDDKLWRMDEDGDWTMVEMLSGFSFYQRPLHLMRNGNWLVHSGCGNVYQVNLKKRNRRRSCSIRSSEIVIEERYMQTLVSPNQYMIK